MALFPCNLGRGGADITLSGSYISAFDIFLPKELTEQYRYISIAGEAARFQMRDSNGNYVNVSSNTDYSISAYMYQNSIYVTFTRLAIVSDTKPWSITLHN